MAENYERRVGEMWEAFDDEIYINFTPGTRENAIAIREIGRLALENLDGGIFEKAVFTYPAVRVEPAHNFIVHRFPKVFNFNRGFLFAKQVPRTICVEYNSNVFLFDTLHYAHPNIPNYVIFPLYEIPMLFIGFMEANILPAREEESWMFEDLRILGVSTSPDPRAFAGLELTIDVEVTDEDERVTKIRVITLDGCLGFQNENEEVIVNPNCSVLGNGYQTKAAKGK